MASIFYSTAYVAAAHAFDTTRKSAWIAHSIRTDPIPGVELVAPEPITPEALARVHDPRYIEAVRTGSPRAPAESQGFEWDPGLWTAVAASTGGAVAAALDALEMGASGSLSSGLHHARRGHGCGFCTFNGLVLAAQAAQDAGAKRILILDLDAHCGGGTHSLVGTDPRVRHLDVSVSWSDTYEPAGQNTLDVVERGREYLPTIERRLDEVLRDAADLDLVIYNSGMDPHEADALAGLRGISTEVLAARERRVFKRFAERGIPIAFVLAGGYIGGPGGRERLVELHRLTIEEAARSADEIDRRAPGRGSRRST